jgi:hypothetical protein
LLLFDADLLTEEDSDDLLLLLDLLFDASLRLLKAVLLSLRLIFYQPANLFKESGKKEK